MDIRTSNEHNFTTAESIFYALRKTKEGVIISFVIHPNELSDMLSRASIGQRMVLALAEISEP